MTRFIRWVAKEFIFVVCFLFFLKHCFFWLRHSIGSSFLLEAIFSGRRSPGSHVLNGLLFLHFYFLEIPSSFQSVAIWQKFPARPWINWKPMMLALYYPEWLNTTQTWIHWAYEEAPIEFGKRWPCITVEKLKKSWSSKS